MGADGAHLLWTYLLWSFFSQKQAGFAVAVLDRAIGITTADERRSQTTQYYHHTNRRTALQPRTARVDGSPDCWGYKAAGNQSRDPGRFALLAMPGGRPYGIARGIPLQTQRPRTLFFCAGRG